jgi:hypothetical protein
MIDIIDHMTTYQTASLTAYSQPPPPPLLNDNDYCAASQSRTYTIIQLSFNYNNSNLSHNRSWQWSSMIINDDWRPWYRRQMTKRTNCTFDWFIDDWNSYYIVLYCIVLYCIIRNSYYRRTIYHGSVSFSEPDCVPKTDFAYFPINPEYAKTSLIAIIRNKMHYIMLLIHIRQFIRYRAIEQKLLSRGLNEV